MQVDRKIRGSAFSPVPPDKAGAEQVKLRGPGGVAGVGLFAGERPPGRFVNVGMGDSMPWEDSHQPLPTVVPTKANIEPWIVPAMNVAGAERGGGLRHPDRTDRRPAGGSFRQPWSKFVNDGPGQHVHLATATVF